MPVYKDTKKIEYTITEGSIQYYTAKI
ncbi:hypothetical protein IR114_04570 [Granulicatella sp. 19428wC4_WM01]|nr:hypothetical protein [Granulicatella sp. 19428wC4_WM01]TFU95504.1 hypothetical protein E4T68_04550 [Granulicatella sp. WM01]